MRKLCSLMVILFISNFVYSAEKNTVAVAEFEGKGVSSSESSAITDFIRNGFVKLKKYVVANRNNMDKILTEQKFQLSGCTDEECAVQMGKLLNVTFIVVGTVSKLGQVYFINANIVSIETGQIVKTGKISSKLLEELPDKIPELIENLEGEQIKEESVKEIKRATTKQKMVGEVVEIRDNEEIVINIGGNDFVFEGDIYTVQKTSSIYKFDKISNKKRLDYTKYIDIAEFKITYVNPNESLGKIMYIETLEKINIGNQIVKRPANLSVKPIDSETERKIEKEANKQAVERLIDNSPFTIIR